MDALLDHLPRPRGDRAQNRPQPALHGDPGAIDISRILAAGRADPQIKALQQELVALGLLDPADVDGIDGPLTQQAKEAYMTIADDVRAIRRDLTTGIFRDRQIMMNGRMKAQGDLLALVAAKVAEGDAAILAAIEELKQSDALDEGVDQ